MRLCVCVWYSLFSKCLYLLSLSLERITSLIYLPHKAENFLMERVMSYLLLALAYFLGW